MKLRSKFFERKNTLKNNSVAIYISKNVQMGRNRLVRLKQEQATPHTD